MFIECPHQNPLINCKQIGPNHQKSQKEKFRKSPLKCMKNAWNHENKSKRKGKTDIPAWGERFFAKISEENDKKLNFWSLPRRREKKEKFLKKFWTLKKSDFPFLKSLFTMFDRSKITFDRSNDTVILRQLRALFRSIENQVGSIEMGRGTLNFGKKHSFEKFANPILKQLLKAFEQWMQNAWVWDGMHFQKPKIFKPTSLKHKFQLSSKLIFSSNKYVVHKSQDIFKLGWSDQEHTH